MRRGLAALCIALLLLLAPLAARAGVEERFQDAKQRYEEFLKDQRAMQRRDLWLAHAERFLSIARNNPRHARAAGCYYWAGFVYRDMFGVSRLERDRDRAIELWRELIKRWPASNLCDDVWMEIAKIHEDRGQKTKAATELQALLEKYPDGDMQRQARLDLARLRPNAPTPTATATPTPASTPNPTPRPTPSATPQPQITPAPEPPAAPGEATLVGVRFWTYPTYTRVVIDLTERVEYRANFMEADVQNGAPRRLYVDFYGAQLHPTLVEPILVGDGLLHSVRCGQPRADVSRVVLDFDRIKDYRVFSLDAPFRLVIDVNAGNGEAEAGERPIRRIVLDAGHGGQDPGAVGRHGGKVRYEKTFTLDLVRRIKPILERELGVEVVLTRANDTFVPLEKRTAIANEQRADLFVSVHINAGRRAAAAGFSTYFLAPKADPSDDELIALLAQENAIGVEAAREINLVLGDLAFSDKLNESSYLAEAVQKSMIAGLRARYGEIEDRGIKRAPFYVLVGAHMPCILVEAGFISNAKEAGRLAQPEFRQALAEAIARGIIDHVRQLEH